MMHVWFDLPCDPVSCKLVGMPPQQRKRASDQDSESSPRRNVSKALTTAGQPCGRQVVVGLTVCKSHGGGTAASVRVSKLAKVSTQAAVLWGISPDASGISVEEELTKLARNKLQTCWLCVLS